MPLSLLPEILQDPQSPMAGLPPGRNINPLMGSQVPQQQAPINPIAAAPQPQPRPQPAPPTGGGGLFANLFGGNQGQELSTKSRKQLGRDALFNAGLSLLESSGPNAQGFTASSLQGLGRSLAAGRESFGSGVADQEAATALQERRRLLQDADTPTKRRGAFQEILEMAVISGDADRIANASTALTAIGDPDKFDFETVDDTLYQFDAGGQLVGVFGGGKEQNVLGVLTDRQFDRIKLPLQDFNQSTADVREVPTQFRRVVTSATPLANLPDNATAEEIEDLSFAAVSALSSYARLIDPNSVVRTSEMELLLGQGSWAEKLETLIKRAVSGTMSPALARALINEAKAQTKAQKESYEGFINQFAQQANAFANLTPEQARRLIINPYDELDIDNPTIPVRELKSAEDEDRDLSGQVVGGVVQLIDEL